jgi:hypothetical protein
VIRIARNISTNISRNVSRSVGTEPDPVLDRYSGASAAYSLYDLGNRRGSVVETEATYHNPAVRLRRTDNADSSFSSMSAINSSMLAWVGADALDNGYTDTVYDQSGNNNDASAPADANQSKAVDAGTVVTDSALNQAIDGDGTDDYFDLTSGIAFTGEFSLFFLIQNSTSGIKTLLGSSGGVSPRIRRESSTNVEITNDAGTEVNCAFDASITNGNTYLLTINRNASDLITIYINGVAQADTETLAGTITFDRLFARDAGNNPFGNPWAAVLLYNGSYDRAAIEDAILSQFGVS